MRQESPKAQTIKFQNKKETSVLNKLTKFATLSVVAATLAACGGGTESCTQADLEAKTKTMLEKVQAVAATDPTKMAELAAKAQEMQTKFSSGNLDLQEACKAYDEILATLE